MNFTQSEKSRLINFGFKFYGNECYHGERSNAGIFYVTKTEQGSFIISFESYDCADDNFEELEMFNLDEVFAFFPQYI